CSRSCAKSFRAVRRSRRGRRASPANASRRTASYGPIFLGTGARRYVISLRVGARSHCLMVFLDRPVRRAISLIDSPSCCSILLTFAYIASVCTSPSLQVSHPQGQSETPWSIFSEQNHDSPVSFQRAATRLRSVRKRAPIQRL